MLMYDAIYYPGVAKLFETLRWTKEESFLLQIETVTNAKMKLERGQHEMK
jgi:hypothetical protein